MDNLTADQTPMTGKQARAVAFWEGFANQQPPMPRVTGSPPTSGQYPRPDCTLEQHEREALKLVTTEGDTVFATTLRLLLPDQGCCYILSIASCSKDRE